MGLLGFWYSVAILGELLTVPWKVLIYKGFKIQYSQYSQYRVVFMAAAKIAVQMYLLNR